ncbi:MAG: VanZ family protein [Bacteroidia bacterium]
MIRYVLPAMCWTIIVTILTLLPGKDLPEVNIINFDKIAHFGVFFLLSLLYLRWKKFGPALNVSQFLIVLIIIAYGGLIELVQGAFYTDRFADIYDFIANSCGAATAALFYPIITSIKH